MVEYHDREWGVPSFDDRHLFEMLSLEGAQAGLSWSTILRKRDGYRRAFARLRSGPGGALRPRGRSRRCCATRASCATAARSSSVVSNARAVLAIQAELGSLAAYLWSFVGGRPLVGRRRGLEELPAATDESRAMSKDLLRRGFRFVGPVTCYAFMQAVGMVNDHEVRCFRHRPLQSRGGGQRRAP